MAELSFSAADIVFAAAVLISAGYATYRGLMRETLSIFAWVAAAFVTLWFFPALQPMLRGYIQPEWLADGVVFVVLFLAVLIPLSFMGVRMSETVKRSEIGPVDRSLGFAFGVVRGLVVAALAYIGFSYVIPLRDHPAWLTEARSLPVIQGTSDVLLGFLPDNRGSAVLAQPRAAPSAVPAPRPARVTASRPSDNPDTTYEAKDRRALDSLIEATDGAAARPGGPPR